MMCHWNYYEYISSWECIKSGYIGTVDLYEFTGYNPWPFAHERKICKRHKVFRMLRKTLLQNKR